MRTDVLKILAESKTYISGEEISEKLGISRAAVWKNINMLKEDGGEVEAITNRGYRLVRMPDVLKPEYVSVYLNKPCVNMKWMESVDSTNTYLKKLARSGGSCNAIAVSEHQTGGKGRLGRAWSSEPKAAVQISFLFKPDVHPSEAPVFNIAAAVVVSRAVMSVCGIDTSIKWPNDVLYGKKKLCGILTEMSSDMDTVEYIICGIGVNANQEYFDGEIADRATSLRIITGEKADRVRLCAAIIDEADICFDMVARGNTDALMEEYCAKSAVIGKDVKLICAGDVVEGRCTGFGRRGELILSDGSTERMFNAGEVSLRGVNDYV